MSDYQFRSMHSDPDSPINQPEWDGMWDCPDCNDHTENVVNPDEPLKDCLDHIEDGDLREHMRKELAYYKRGLAIKDARIHELELGLDAIDKGLKAYQELERQDRELRRRMAQELQGQEAIVEVGKHE